MAGPEGDARRHVVASPVNSGLPTRCSLYRPFRRSYAAAMREGRSSGTVTVLFTDLVGSAGLMARLGDTAFDQLRRAHFAALRQAIERSGGQEVKNTGDGLLAIFGSVGDAVGCAVAIQQATARPIRSRGAVPLAVRVGLSVGDVTFDDDDVFGAPVVEAARLVAAAGPGEIVTTHITRALAGRASAHFIDVGPLQLKGLPDPVPACHVLWEPVGGPSTPLPALLTDLGPIFVGRDGELERLDQLWKDAAAGERRVCLLAGEPGVGKTRLAAELSKRVHPRGAVVLAGRCDEGLGVPYQPFVEALRHFLDHTGAADLEALLGRYGPELARLVPEIAELAPGLARPIRSDPETERYRLFDAVGSWLAAVSNDQPVLLVLDDLHWATKPTLLLFRHVTRMSDPMRLLIVGTYRDSELPHGHPLIKLLGDFRRQTGVERISVSGLDPSAVAAFIEADSGAALEDQGLGLATVIHHETEGNPFFVREVLRHLTESGRTHPNVGDWTSATIGDLGIPEGVRDAVGRRLARLSAGTNRILRIGAVVGSEFDFRLIQSVAGLDDEDLLATLDEAAEAHVLLDVASPARYRFAHVLVRDTVYDGLSATRRAVLHRQVAESIELLHAGHLDDHLPALAHHWSKASMPVAETAKAVDYASRAGDRALAQLAHDEAVAYYHQALELLEAEAPGESEGRRRLGLMVTLGDAQRRAGDSGFRNTLLNAAALARVHGDSDALSRAALANTRGAYWSSAGTVDHDRVAVLEAALAAVGDVPTAVRARLLATLGIELVWTEDRTRRRRLSDEALDIARSLGDMAVLAHVLMTRVYTINAPDTLGERLDCVSELLTVSDKLADPYIAFMAHFLKARVALETDEVTDRSTSLESAKLLAAELGQPTLHWMVRWVDAGHLLLAGGLDDADRCVDEALQIGESNGEPDARPIYTLERWSVRFEQGRLGELEPELTELCSRFPAFPGLQTMLAAVYCDLGRNGDARRCLQRLAATSFDLPRNSLWLGLLIAAAEVACHLDDRAAARTIYERLRPYPTTFGFPVAIGCSAHYLGKLATTLGDYTAADGHFVVAATAHRRVGAPCCLARTRLEWARMLLSRCGPGDNERAVELLDQAAGTARELGLPKVAAQAAELQA